MESKVRTYTWPDGTIQRVHTVMLPGWENLNFLELDCDASGLACYASIYSQYLVPACPWLFGNLVMFTLPEDGEFPASWENGPYGSLASPLTAAALGLRRGLRLHRGSPRFRDRETEAFWNHLLQQGCVRIVRGRLPITTIIPVKKGPGFLSESCADARMKVNASFFIMDPFDCATAFDHVGTSLGLMVKDGVVTKAPLYNREALLVRKSGSVTVENLDIRDLTVSIGGRTYRHGENCHIYTRPRHPRVAARGTKLVITGCRVEAVCRGNAPVPASGFVLCPREETAVEPGTAVDYLGLGDVAFGIQVGNSILRDGVKTDTFRSRFYNIRHLEPVPYPPSLYPMNFDTSRAARIALGADKAGNPVVLWAEGAPKLGYVPGKHSRGATLLDMGTFCQDAGMVQAVNLDGGGSAQLLVENQRLLEISDRNPDGTQAERLVPNGLVVK